LVLEVLPSISQHSRTPAWTGSSFVSACPPWVGSRLPFRFWPKTDIQHPTRCVLNRPGLSLPEGGKGRDRPLEARIELGTTAFVAKLPPNGPPICTSHFLRLVPPQALQKTLNAFGTKQAISSVAPSSVRVEIASPY